MNEVQIFNSEEFGNVRTLQIDGKPYFVASDVAKALGYSNPRKAVADHCKGVTKRDTPTFSGIQSMSYINEGDLYRLIMRSKLPNAEKFEKWVVEDVLPSIRKHGMYAVDELVNNPDLLIKVATELKEERENSAKLTKKIEEQKPLVDFANHVSRTKDTIDMDEMSKIAKDENIDIGRNRLIKWLKENKILKDNRVPYQLYMDRGYFKVVEVPKDTVYGTKVFLKTVITGKGQIWLIEKLRKEYCT